MTSAHLLGQPIAAEAALAAIMAGAWAIERSTGRAGWIDAVWTLGVGATSVVLALAPVGASQAHAWRAVAVAIAAALWSLRLGLHIVGRTLKTPDDPRYRKLIDEWGAAAPARLFLFLQAQALVGASLALSVALAAQAASPAMRWQDVSGLIVFATALIGEAAADAELARFKADPARLGQICDIGLWRRSRHPNYFFEWLIWVGFAVVASGEPAGAVAWIAPALMYWTLRYASGVPPLEEHLARTRGAAFADYRARTPAFFPRIL